MHVFTIMSIMSLALLFTAADLALKTPLQGPLFSFNVHRYEYVSQGQKTNTNCLCIYLSMLGI